MRRCALLDAPLLDEDEPVLAERNAAPVLGIFLGRPKIPELRKIEVSLDLEAGAVLLLLELDTLPSVTV